MARSSNVTAVVTSNGARPLLPHHGELIEKSAISAKVAAARGYWSETKKAELARLGFGPAQQLVPTLVIPVHGVTGEVVTYQHRPDTPRVRDGVKGHPIFPRCGH